MVQATLIKKIPYSDKYGAGLELTFSSSEGEYKTKKNEEFLGKLKNVFIKTLEIGSYVELTANPQGSGYFVNQSKIQPEKKEVFQKQTTDFKTIDPDGIFEEAKPDINTKFEYAEKAFNKAFDIVINKTEKEERGFESEDIRTMINTVYMSLTK